MCFSSKHATQPISFLIEEVHIIFFFPFAVINILEKDCYFAKTTAVWLTM